MSTTPKFEDLTIAEMEAALAEKKTAEKDVLLTEIASLEKLLAGKHELLAKITGAPAPVPAKRGRKSKGNFITRQTKAAKKGTGKRNTGLKETVLAFLKTKGSKGAHVDEIAANAGAKKANINAFLATTGKKAGIKGKGDRTGIYFLK